MASRQGACVHAASAVVGNGGRPLPHPRGPSAPPDRSPYDVAVTDTFLGAADLAEDARQLLAELDKDVPGAAAINTDCRPAVDVFETASAVEIVADVPGVSPESIRVAIRRNTLLVVGAKMPAAVGGSARFHIAERSYGRFARVVRLNGAFDATRARAAVRSGQLRITLPRLEDRRGRILRIPVDRE